MLNCQVCDAEIRIHLCSDGNRNTAIASCSKDFYHLVDKKHYKFESIVMSDKAPKYNFKPGNMKSNWGNNVE